MLIETDVKEKIRNLIRSWSCVDLIYPESSFVNHLEFDTIDFFDFILALEKEFEIIIKMSESKKFITVEDVNNYILNKIEMRNNEIKF